MSERGGWRETSMTKKIRIDHGERNRRTKERDTDISVRRAG
jgi:hypothetical protein